MNTWSTFRCPCSVLVSVALFFIIAVGSNAQQNEKLANLAPIATIDGKTYFAELQTQMTWAAASSFCKSNGMRLASIKTQAQRNALANATWNIVRTDAVWTGGRDSRRPSQFSWESDEQTLIPEFQSYFMAYNPISSCVSYWPYYKVVQSHPCSKTHRPLCEFVHGK